MPNDNTQKRTLIKTGTVVGDKMQKTIIVRIDRVTHHPKYNKIMRKSVKVKAHDEKNAAKIGDTVKIMQVRPISKDKRWKLLEIINPSTR